MDQLCCDMQTTLIVACGVLCVCVCVACAYSVVSIMPSSLKKDLIFTTGRTVLYLSAVNTAARSALLMWLLFFTSSMSVCECHYCYCYCIAVLICQVTLRVLPVR